MHTKFHEARGLITVFMGLINVFIENVRDMIKLSDEGPFPCLTKMSDVYQNCQTRAIFSSDKMSDELKYFSTTLVSPHISR